MILDFCVNKNSIIHDNQIIFQIADATLRKNDASLSRVAGRLSRMQVSQ
jgi:hypothetical protein